MARSQLLSIINKNVKKKPILLFFVLLFPSVLYLVLSTGKHHFTALPYFGPREAITTMVNGKEKPDTLYHSIPPFKFVNQLGDTITDKDYDHRIYVADFFFTTCQSICPKMSRQMERIQKKFWDNDSVMMISHTVNPEGDSVEVLAAYAKTMNANSKRWNFVTGDKKQIYDIAREGYFLPVDKGDGGPDDFIHSEKFILVDKNKHIRGIFDGTDTKDVDRLFDAIKMLLAEDIIKHSKKQTITQGER